MRAFFIGLLFLCATALLTLLGFLLLPLLFLLGIFLRIIFIILLCIFAIWLLGRFIIFVWEALIEK